MLRRNESFGRLIKAAIKSIGAIEGKKELIIQEELGELIGCSAATIPHRTAGYIPTDPREIEIFAEAGVRRGLLGRIWLERMLELARYPDARRLSDTLCPQPSSERPPPRASDNLPTPTYPSFIMRREAYDQVLEGLAQRTPAVVLVSMGGMGKSSLALEVAVQTARRNKAGGNPHAPGFDSAVWISDRDKPGTIRLGHVLDEIARTLDRPGYTALEPRQKQAEVEQLLRLQRVLLVVDNAETVADPALLQWLLRLPEPSKALITTRSYQPEFRRGAWLVELDGMDEAAVGEMVSQIARQLKLALPAGGAAERSAQLFRATGGNPRAIELILGLVKFQRRPLADVLTTLNDSRSELFGDLYAQSWHALSPGGKLTLMALSIFPASCAPSSLATVTELPSDQLELALGQLQDLALLDAVVGDWETSHGPRLQIHPLTRSFAAGRLAEQPELALSLRQRWVSWCSAFAATHGGFTLDDIGRLSALDAEEPTLYAATAYALAQGRHREAIALVKSIEYYYHVRAYWSRKAELYGWYVAAAEALGDRDEAINALALSIQLLSRQGHLDQAARLSDRLDQLMVEAEPAGAIAFAYHHTRGLYLLSQATDDPAQAQAAVGHWRWLLDRREGLADHMVAGAYFWLAAAVARQGDDERARDAYREALAYAATHGFTRFVGRCQLGLAVLELKAGERDRAAALLAASRGATRPDDWEQQAQLDWGEARLATLDGDLERARAAYTRAIDHLERMGLSYERAEAAAELRTLGEG